MSAEIVAAGVAVSALVVAVLAIVGDFIRARRVSNGSYNSGRMVVTQSWMIGVLQDINKFGATVHDLVTELERTNRNIERLLEDEERRATETRALQEARHLQNLEAMRRLEDVLRIRTER